MKPTQIMRIRSLLVCLLLIVSSMGIYAQNIGEVIDTPAPSQETWEQIQQMGQGPSLRARPGDIDGSEKPNKVPLYGYSIYNLLLITLSIATYKLYKIKKQEK